ncbi:hypothetical protein H6G64_03940 [Calothrix sp. FACHB-156]|nr:hypothetical protein [Calothrix sp. FACHB-156]
MTNSPSGKREASHNDLQGQQVSTELPSTKVDDSLITKTEIGTSDPPQWLRGETPQNLLNAGAAIAVLVTVITLIRALTELVKASRQN